MSQLTLQEIVTAHTDALAAHSEGFLPTIRLLLLQGAGPVSPSRLATAMQWTPQQVEAFVHDNDLAIDDRCHIQIVPGSGCALDTLLLAMLTGQQAHIVRTCPATGRQIRLTVTPEGIRAYGHYFVSREAATTWPGLHPEAVLLSVEDAARLAEALANAARTYAEKSE